jgi:hypothetical protein
MCRIRAAFLLLLLCIFSFNTYAQTRYESESANLANVSVASTYAGYSGTGYVTNITSEWSRISFDRSVSENTNARLAIRYANGNASAVTHLAFYIGSTKVQNLSFPSTGSWTTWSTLSIDFALPAGYQNLVIKGESNASNSINLDYTDLTTGVTPAPGTFSQNTPASGATGVSVTPAFSWGASSGASTYSLVVSTNSSLTSPVINVTNLTSTSYTPASALSNSTTYYWRVTAVNGSGSTVASNGGISFTTVAPLPAPGTFSQTAPASGATGVALTPTFTWGSSSNAASYTIVVSTNSALTSPVINQSGLTSTSFTPSSALSGSTVYYWRVSAVNATGTTVASNAGISFTTTAPLPAPGTFSQTAPASGASGVSRTPAFTWGASSNAASYTLVVSTNSGLTSPVINQSGITATSYTPASSLSASTTYYWRVTAVNATSSTVASNGGISFTTAALPAPGSFSQTAPASGATGVSTTPQFTWGASSDAASYTLTVSTSSSLANPVVNVGSITGTSYSLSTALANNTVYYWRVSATNSTSTTNATNSGISFTTADTPAPPPAQPGLIREYWAGISGSSVSSLTSNAAFPNSPTSSSVITSFDAPKDVAEEYGQRIRGYLKPSTTGSYQFFIASDDDSELWLSTDDQPSNKVKIASVTGWTNQYQYNKYGSQQSASINLTANKHYYIEALHKEGSGGDHVTVAWQGPGISHQVISSAYLVTAAPVPVPLPGTFSQTAPASGATGVSLTPAFSWGASSNAASYTLEVSTTSSFSNLVINQTGITGTSFTPGGGLNGTTTYYWRVTAVNETGTRVSSNAGISFTTLTPPAPGSFSQTAPANNATGTSRTPTFTWGASSNASSYALVVSTSSSYTSPVINVSNLTTTSYTPAASLAANTKYYWKVTATNSTGPTVATNAGISFTTSSITGTYYYVSTTGVDAVGRGSEASPYRTIAYAAQQVPAGPNVTIYVNPGTYVETQAIQLKLGVNLEGAGQSAVTITASGPIPAPQGVDTGSADWKLWYYGSLIQLYSAGYSGGPEQLYGSPDQMVASSNGNQTLSGFTVDGNNKQVKAGVWVQNRNNVTMNNVTIKNCQQRGAVFTRSDMWWYEPMPEGKWMHNSKIYNCTFQNNGAQLGSETLGNLCLGGLDGADIYNLTITDDVGYGIKFMMVGHFRNTKIHDCNITVNETDAQWGEKIAIELWNLSYGNEVYNITCNTWHSYVNHGQLTTYEPTGTNTNNLKVYNVRMIDSDGSSSKEAIEAALSGVEIYNCFIQDKGFGIAIWNGAGQTLKKNYIIRNNIITNVLRTPGFGFGKSSAVFVPDAAQNIKIYNNVFDRMGNALNLDGATGVDVRNNVFINTQGADVENGASVTFNNNLKYHTDPNKTGWVMTGGPTVGTGNLLGAPGFQNTGSRWDTYYKPSSSSSLVVDKGANVGLPYVGAAPDMGRWEFGASASSAGAAEMVILDEDHDFDVYPNPGRGLINIESSSHAIRGVKVYNVNGQLIGEKSNDLGTDSVQIDLTEQRGDLYLLKIQHEKGLTVKKYFLSR